MNFKSLTIALAWNIGRMRLSNRIVLAYHGIWPGPTDNFLTVELENFIWQIEFVKKYYRIVTLEEVLESESGDRVAAITIDDCYARLLPEAIEFIRNNRIPVALFAPTGLLGGSIAAREKKYPVMTSSDLLSIDSGLFSIGSHSITHRELTDLSDGEKEMEIRRSKEDLQNLLGHEVNLFAYPRGKYDCDIRNMTEMSGYTHAVTIEPGAVPWGCDPFQIPRVSVLRSTSRNMFRLMLTGLGDRIVKAYAKWNARKQMKSSETK